MWLNANRYGLSSLDETNGYVRGALFRPLSADADRRLGLGYGVDVAIPVNYTSDVVLQQAYVEGRWLHGTLTIGAKEEPMQLKINCSAAGRRRSVSMRVQCRRFVWRYPTIGRCR